MDEVRAALAARKEANVSAGDDGHRNGERAAAERSIN